MSKNLSSNYSKLGRSEFVDRDQELERLHHLFFKENERIAAITGGPGTGKTALAMAFYEKFASKFPGDVLRIDLDSNRDFDLLGLSIRQTIEDNKHFSLIILDSDKFPEKPLDKQLGKIWTASPKSKILLVSRHVIQDLPVGNQINLENFTLEVMGKFINSLGIKLEPIALQDLYLHVLGNPVATLVLIEKLRSENLSHSQLMRALSTFNKCGLIDRHGLPLDSDSEPYRTIITEVEFVNDELLQKLSSNPHLLYELTPRAFEEVIAELLQRLGYQVTLTPASNDGGKDIYAARKNAIGSFLYLVECKRYAPGNRVGVELVRQLYGVVQDERATAGILATTSFFTRGAHEFQRNVSFQISLKDFWGIQKWLRSAVIDVT